MIDLEPRAFIARCIHCPTTRPSDSTLFRLAVDGSAGQIALS